MHKKMGSTRTKTSFKLQHLQVQDMQFHQSYYHESTLILPQWWSNRDLHVIFSSQMQRTEVFLKLKQGYQIEQFTALVKA